MTTLFCPAKINLFLAIREKDTSGYHKIETILARTNALQDCIEIEPAQKLQIEFHPGEGIEPENNTVTKAIQCLEARSKHALNYHIHITKNIPPRSGLGGAASNAASILLYLNEQEALGLSLSELMDLATHIGMDVPFFVSGHDVAQATHYGEKIIALSTIPASLEIAVELTGHEISTKEAYKYWDSSARAHHAPPPIQPLLIALQNQDPEALTTATHNDFELITPECGPYSKTRHLCGSGGAVYHFC